MGRTMSATGRVGREAEAAEDRVAAPVEAMLRQRRPAGKQVTLEHEGMRWEAGEGPAEELPLVASPSRQRKLLEKRRRELEAAQQGAAVVVTGAGAQAAEEEEVASRRHAWACLWVAMLALLAAVLALPAAWRKAVGPYPIGTHAALIGIVSRLFPLVHHEDHEIDMASLPLSRKRLDLLDYMNIAPRIEGTEDLRVPSTKANHSIPIRLYFPRGFAAGRAQQQLSPALMWIHGGGWTLGSIASDDKIARRLAAATGAVVASVEYRLAPEHKYPAQMEDTLDAIEFLLAHGAEHGIDTSRVALAGESAGGHLTIVTAMALDAAKDRLCGIMPVVPATDFGCDSESCQLFRDGYMLTQGQVKAFWHSKLSDPETEQHHHYVSPLRAPTEAMANLPPMLVITAGLDPLRDEGEAFVAKAQDAGVEAELVRFPLTIHGFFGRTVTNGGCGVRHAAQWFQRTCRPTETAAAAEAAADDDEAEE